MDRIKKISFSLLILFGFFPTFVSASEVSSASNQQLLQQDITVVDNEISPMATKEAIVRNTAKQRLLEGKWQKLTNITYRSIWFTNGVTETGYIETNIYHGWNYIEYTYLFQYRVW